jgi:hypothetical protein
VLWPWITRRAHEKEVRLLKAKLQVQRLTSEKQVDLQRELTALLRSCQEHVFQLKRQGFEVPIPVGEPEPGPALPDAVALAIEERAEPGTPLYSQLSRWAWRQLRAEVEPGDVADEILEGGYVL